MLLFSWPPAFVVWLNYENTEKSFFRQHQVEYLGFWITRDDSKYKNINIEAKSNMKPLTSRKEVQKFIGVVNYYHNMWTRQSHTLATLTKLTPVKNKLNGKMFSKMILMKLSVSWAVILCQIIWIVMKCLKFTPMLAHPG